MFASLCTGMKRDLLEIQIQKEKSRALREAVSKYKSPISGIKLMIIPLISKRIDERCSEIILIGHPIHNYGLFFEQIT